MSFLIIFLNSCSGLSVNNAKEITIEDLKNISREELIGKKVTVTGKAVNLHLGAVLVLEDSSWIWMDNLLSWPEGYYNGENEAKTLKVTGTVIERYDLPVFIQDEDSPARSGISMPKGTDLKKASHRFLLKKFKWVLVKD